MKEVAKGIDCTKRKDDDLKSPCCGARDLNTALTCMALRASYAFNMPTNIVLEALVRTQGSSAR